MMQGTSSMPILEIRAVEPNKPHQPHEFLFV